MLIVTACCAAFRHTGKSGVGTGHHERSHRIGESVAYVGEEQFVELYESALSILVGNSCYLLEHKRVTANCALTKYDETAREDICAFNRNRDGDRLIISSKIVFGS